MPIKKDWQEALIHMLMDAGVLGVTEGALTVSVRDHVDPGDAVMFLEFLQAQGKADKYLRGDVTLWRATSKIRASPQD